MRLIALVALLLVSACSAPRIVELPSRAAPLPEKLPEIRRFAPLSMRPVVRRSNIDIARDFLDLSFAMESGRALPRLTRFEGPVTVAFSHPGGALMTADLQEVVRRLKTEAGIPISLLPPGSPANIVIETLPRHRLRRAVPQAACFVVPRVTSWKEFQRSRLGDRLDWSSLDRRNRAAIFIPDDVSPQETRDCLNEELAQALGPLNDLYRLGDSVFNDDNILSVLTPFDMLVLRIYYSRALHNGMTRDEVAARLPRLLRRLNPVGEKIAPRNPSPSPRKWINAIETALGPGTSPQMRINAARHAVRIADQQQWKGNRLGFSLYVLGRLTLGNDNRTATDAFHRAYKAYAGAFGTRDIHTAHVALQLAALTLSQGKAKAALSLVNESIPAAMRARNAGLLATLMMVKAEALDALGRSKIAQRVRLDSIGWARYGFASTDEIRARLQETAALRPARHRPEPEPEA